MDLDKDMVSDEELKIKYSHDQKTYDFLIQKARPIS